MRRSRFPRTALALLVAPLLAGAGLGGGLPTAPAAAAPAAQSGEVRVGLLPGENEARYRAQEQLVGQPLPNEAVGRTRDASGEIMLGASGAPIPEQSRIVVDLRTLRSDEPRRDFYIQANTLQTQQYPTAEFVPYSAPGLPWPLPVGEVSFQLEGDLTVRGVTRPALWEVRAVLGEQDVAGLAVTQVKLTDFGMTPPQVGPVLSISDDLVLELEFRAGLSAPLALAR